MNKLEIIRNIIKEDSNLNTSNLLENNELYNLTILCILNKKYLTDENLNIILSSKKTPVYNLLSTKNKRIEADSYSLEALLVSKYHNLLDELPSKIIKKFNTFDWLKIIKEQPDLFDRCNISKTFSYNV